MLPQARVMLAPSLTDGVPNAMMEAMALGSFPIVSPLDTITPVVDNETNVLFARNLYPDEIAAALVRAMSDDALVDAAAERNLKRVAEIADRTVVTKKALNFYAEVAAMASAANSKQ
jgi:glycosyltransferase involved in cell wall biosynthesis